MQNTQIEKLSRIIIIGENQDEARGIVDALVSDYSISAVSSVTAAAERMRNETFNVIIYDFHEEGDDIDEIVKNLQQLSPLTPIIITGPMKDARLVVQAIKAGATDFLTKPLVAEKMRLAVNQAIENRSLKNEIDYLRRQQDVAYDYDRIIAESPSMKKVMVSIRRLAQTESTILMTGETGTGKSFLSGNIHFNSPRRRKPFIKVNCANIPETLLESELFGHEKGAFTGADKARVGRFEQADGGTLFLDEFCELSFELQSKLLRVLEEKKITRIGNSYPIPVDFRLISATRRDLEQELAAGHFREDFFYRINVITILIPPLRERKEDIPLLIEHFLEKFSHETVKQVDHITRDTIERLIAYKWPGNVRELENAIERAVVLSKSRTIDIEDFSFLQAPPTMVAKPRSLREMEKYHIQRILEECGWNITRAAKILDINRVTLHKKIKRFDMQKDT